MKYQPGCTPTQTVNNLKEALKTAEYAHHCALLWFSEIMRRKIYRQLGHSSMGQFATLELGFSKTKTCNYLKLCTRLNELPRLREAMESGRLGYTKALEVIKVATPSNEEDWVGQAESQGRAELRRRIKKVRERARKLRREETASNKDAAKQPGAELPFQEEAKGEAPPAAGAPKPHEPGEPETEALAASLPVRLTVEFEPEQWARLEALEAGLRRKGHKTSRRDKAQLLLDALESLLEGQDISADSAVSAEADGGPDNEKKAPIKFRRRNPVQIVVQHCPRCETAKVATNRGDKVLSPSTFERLQCDAQIQEPGKPNKSTLTQSTKRLAMGRDGHRCRAAGCTNTQHLEVHHVIPRSKGGTNRLDNLITLCRGCHLVIHDKGELPGGIA